MQGRLRARGIVLRLCVFLVLYIHTDYTYMHAGCLGLSGEETCDNSDIKELGPYDNGTPHKLFDVHNLLFGLVCFGAPLVILGIKVVIWYRSRRNSDNPLYKATVIVCAVLVVVHALLLFAILFTSLFSISSGYRTIDILKSIDNSTVAMEVCSPWPLYSVIVSSTVIVGVIGLGFVFFLFLVGVVSVKWMYNCITE